jgi:pimeloyl-ACP methyl ester carboxylesterase
MSKCIVCHEREARVPDRNRPGRPIKRVCRECHAARLTGDLTALLKARTVPTWVVYGDGSTLPPGVVEEIAKDGFPKSKEPV